MGRKRYTAERIIGMLREVEVELSRGQKLGHICRNLGITEQTYYRWCREYGGMKVTQAKRKTELDNRRPHRRIRDIEYSSLRFGSKAKFYRHTQELLMTSIAKIF